MIGTYYTTLHLSWLRLSNIISCGFRVKTLKTVQITQYLSNSQVKLKKKNVNVLINRNWIFEKKL